MKATTSAIESLLDKVQIMEKRPLSEHVSVREVEPLWPIVSRKGIMHSTTKRLVEMAFDHGGFVAGGFGRWAASSGRSAMERGEYMARGGDIDLFFHERAGWQAYLEQVGKLDDEECLISTIGPSQGNLAVNFLPKSRQQEHTYNAPMPMQAVGCAVGTPAQILRSFDFVNCMFAIGRDASWGADEALELEKERVLGISSWSSRGLVHRLSKYRTKYGYARCRDMSEGRRLDHLCDAAGRHTTAESANRAALHWASFMLYTPENFFEDPNVANDILSCGILPFDEAGTWTMDVVSKKRPTVVGEGLYQSGIVSLLVREAKAKALSEEQFNSVIAAIETMDEENVRYTHVRHYRDAPDPPAWTAEQYCWSF